MLDSVTNLASLLKDPSLLVTKAYVAGQWIDADDGTTFAVTNPARGDVICHLPNLGRAETARAQTTPTYAQSGADDYRCARLLGKLGHRDHHHHGRRIIGRGQVPAATGARDQAV